MYIYIYIFTFLFNGQSLGRFWCAKGTTLDTLAMSKQTYPCIHIQENPRSIAACLLKTTMPLSQGAQTRGECDCWCGAGWKSWKACHVPARQGPRKKGVWGVVFHCEWYWYFGFIQEWRNISSSSGFNLTKRMSDNSSLTQIDWTVCVHVMFTCDFWI